MASVLTMHLAGRGGDVAALRALPPGTPAPGVLVVHDAWGLDDEVADLVAALADAGFAPLAPDLLDGRRAADAGAAAALAAGLDAEDAALVLAHAIDALTASSATAPGPIATVGLGMGAPLAAFLATIRPEIGLAVVAGPLPDLPLDAWGRADARFVLLAPVEETVADGAADGASGGADAADRDAAGAPPAGEEAAAALRAAGLVAEVHVFGAPEDLAAAVVTRLRDWLPGD